MGYSENVKEIVNDLIQDGDFVEMGCLKLIAIHTPGHTKDSYCFQLDNNLFTGDTLLINGTGRTDLSTGSAELLYKSLREKILALNENTIIFPAHDYSKKKYSTLKEELNNNPRLRIKSKSKFIMTMNNLDLAPPKHYLEAVERNSLSFSNYLFKKKKSLN